MNEINDDNKRQLDMNLFEEPNNQFQVKLSLRSYSRNLCTILTLSYFKNLSFIDWALPIIIMIQYLISIVRNAK